ncbi:hypothetical protein PMG11_03357 [Penicillium brasilianum]|uniref:Uncharacterized protein n=1 Tax=Penicillium brasilianum TaxID=104259 RepID=A0A0F7V9X9_PENBI|nr:hypothetical protein PMG11_03357 [Penicillium brasilianum]
MSEISDPESSMHDRQLFREELLTWANTLNEGSVLDSSRMKIAAELDEMVKDIEVLGAPPPLGSLLAEDFDLIDRSSEDEDLDCHEGFELIDPLAEADFGRLCSKDGTVRDTLSWAGDLLRRGQAPASDIAIILEMLALHVGRLRFARVSDGVVVDPYADKMDDLAGAQHKSNHSYGNGYLQAIWNRLYNCMDCNCDKCSLMSR